MNTSSPESVKEESLGEYVRLNRFSGTGVIEEIVEHVQKTLLNDSPKSSVILIHSPYPSSSTINQEEVSDEELLASSGLGAGKSDLLYIIAKKLKETEKRLTVLDLLENRDRASTIDNFYEEILLEKIYELDKRILYPTSQRIANWLVSNLTRVSIFIRVALPPLLGIIGYFAGWVGFRAVEFFSQYENAPLLNTIGAWFANYQNLLFYVGILLLVVWGLFAWGSLQKDENKELLDKLRKLGQEHIKAEQIANNKEVLSSQPKELLRLLTKKKKKIVLLIDDVDTLDSISLNSIIQLYDASKDSYWQISIILSYNPASPALNHPKRRNIQRILDEDNIKDNQFLPLQIEPVLSDQILRLLWGYYRNEACERTQRLLEQKFEEARQNPGLLLSFFLRLDKEIGRDDFIRANPDEIITRFEKYLNRDRRAVADILDFIKTSAPGTAEGCFDLLKYLLAFRNRPVQKELLSKLVSSRGHSFEDCAQVLMTDEIQLIKQESRDRILYFSFNERYLCSVLNSGWSEWRENSSDFYTDVFLTLHADNNLKRNDAELALHTKPSKPAIDFLWRIGESLLRFNEASDISSALRFYGAEAGGALDKYLQVFWEGIEDEKDVWSIIKYGKWRQNEKARLNPLKGWSNESYAINQYGSDLFLPLMILVTGYLYWHNGRPDITQKLWQEDWGKIYQKLAREEHTSDDALALEQIDAQIKYASAKMMYSIGKLGGWDSAKQIADTLVQNYPKPDFPIYPSFLSCLIQYYRDFGVGNILPPYHFLRADANLVQITELIESLPSDAYIERFHLLHVLCDSFWQITKTTLPELSELAYKTELYAKINTKTYQEFLKALNIFQDNIESVQTKQRSWKYIWSDNRIYEAEILFWKGYYLLWRIHHFQVDVSKEASVDKKLFEGYSSKTAEERVSAWYSLVHTMKNFCTNYLPERKMPHGFAEVFSQAENAYENWRQAERRKRRDLEESLKKSALSGYRICCNEILEQSRKQFTLADSIYRSLGHQPGLAAVAFARVSLAQIENRIVAFGTQPAWLEEFNRYSHLFFGELGYHIEALKAFIYVGNWAHKNDIPRAVEEYQSALVWSKENDLKLPKAISGELNFLVGNMIGDLDYSTYSEIVALNFFNEAAKALNELEENPKYIDQDEITDRRLTISWWIAELSLRQAQNIENKAERDPLLERVIDEAQKVINKARKKKDRDRILNESRLIKGRALQIQGNYIDGFNELEEAAKFFINEKDWFNSVQALTNIVRTAWGLRRQSRHSEDETTYMKNASEYIPTLDEKNRELQSRLGEFGYVGRLIYCRASELLGEIGEEIKNFDAAIYWLEMTFSTYESLGLFSKAVSLTLSIRNVYTKIGDIARLNQHKDQVIRALQRIDPTRESMPSSYIMTTILSDFGKETVFSQSAHLKTKEELFETATHALKATPPDFSGVVQILEKANALIDIANPDEKDIKILNLLRLAYFQIGNQEKALEIRSKMNALDNTINCCSFLNIAKHFKSRGLPYTKFLELATRIKLENAYYQEAERELQEVEQVIGSGENLDNKEDEGTALELEELLNKPITEFTAANCSRLLDRLENGLRRLIAERLSRLSPQWWKQRIPNELRIRAEERKQERERNYPGMAQQNRPLYDYLDFTDLAQIITMKLNWNDVFKDIFKKQELVIIKLGEISPLRNDIAHNRDLPSSDKELFISNARQFIRTIKDTRIAENSLQAKNGKIEDKEDLNP